MAIHALVREGVKYIAICNADITYDSTCLERLVTLMESDGSIGACQPLLLYSDEPHKVEMFGGAVDVRTGDCRHEFKGETRFETLPSLWDVGYLDGGSMLIRADVLRQIGHFDEKFFMYFEDVDLSVRIQKAGFRTVAIRDARAWHYHRQQLGILPAPYQLFYETRNRFYFVWKHGGPRAWCALVGITLLSFPQRLVFFLRRRKLNLAAALLSGLACGVCGRMGKRGWVEG